MPFEARIRRVCFGGVCFLLLMFFWRPAQAEHKVAHCRPDPAEALFPSDFPTVRDTEWGYRMGGWGGLRQGAPLRHRPVIFVHGNTRDAGDWDEAGNSVKQRFLEAGYSMQELWGLSYNGKSTKNLPPPLQCRTDNTTNISDLTAFVNAVLAYTGAQEVDIIAHSLGVTLVRRMLKAELRMGQHIRKFVGIAGPNHGTTLCRRAWLLWFIGWKEFMGCDELVPGSVWLQQLNGTRPVSEAPGRLHYLMIYDGTGADMFYRSSLFGWPVGDTDSPALDGAENRRLPGLTHDELRTDKQAIGLYRSFILSAP